MGTARDALAGAGVGAGDLAAIGLTNQRETVVAWDERTGEPLHHAIVWQDRRTAARCDELRERGLEELVRERTGLVIDPYFSGTKVEWLLDNVEGLRDRARDGHVRFGTIDAWLAFKLTGRAVTDYSNASRTMLFDIHTLSWDADLCEAARRAGGLAPRGGALGPRRSARPSPAPSSARGSRWRAWPAISRRRCSGRPASSPGSGRTRTGPAASSCMNAGAQHPPVRRGAADDDCVGRRGTRGLRARGERVRDRRRGPVAARRIGDHRRGCRDRGARGLAHSNEGVYFVPALTGLGSPHWDPYARGTIVGLTRGSGREHLARAALEAIAYQTVDAVQAMEAASGRAARRAAGGRRRGRQRLADAVPGGRPRPAGGGPRDDGDDCARRGLPRRCGRRGAGPRRTWSRCGVRGRATSPGWVTTSASR